LIFCGNTCIIEVVKKTYKYKIITFGCQMNKNDSERIESVFLHMGMIDAKDETKADVILLNTCSVRESAEYRVFGKVHNLLKLKEKNPNIIVCVTGCMPGRDKKNIMGRKMKGADLYFPTKDIVHLPKWLYELNPDFRTFEDLENDYLAIRPTIKKEYQAFVSIQTGCNHFCTYCVVPFARGLEVNRSLKAILDEVNSLVKKGCLEITLLGQIVNHYIAPDKEFFSKENPYKKSDFAKLLWELNQIDGIERIHYTAPHPIFMTDEVIDALTLPKQVNFLHLPVQSGSSDILKKMNRRHDRKFFLDIIKKIKAKKPDIAIGTDIIVGFCGESKKDFEETVSMYEECEFDISYNAQYSVRSGTLAANTFEDSVSKEEKKKRWWVLQELMEEITYKKNQKYLGEVVEVMVENYQDGWCTGNSSEMKRVRFEGSEDMIGSIVKIKITKADTWMLWGVINFKF
jgi:tRNA-2-methylthio-N6-dimethylallyladenosine synthase